MSDREELLDRPLAIERLNSALELQYRSALQYSVAAASLTGLEAQVLGEPLRDFGDRELEGAREVIEKIVSLDGSPTVKVADLEFHEKPDDAIGWLIECEEAGVEALQEAIEPTGREARSEALEHMLEHQILRKQHQIDFLKRVTSR